MNNIYLDYAATTPVRKEILEAYKKLLDLSYANSDSIHELGSEAGKYLSAARKQISTLLGVKEKEIIFTSGSTESNNVVIKGVAMAYKGRGNHIITTSIEHPSLLDSCKWLEENLGFEVTYLPVNKEGKIELEELKKAIRKDTILVSIMAVNNELGSINDIYGLSKYVKENTNALFHTDATQAMGKETIDYTFVDLFNFSGHKIYSLKGSGVLVKKEKARIVPLISGGQQERGLRGGTSNYHNHVMSSKALRIAFENHKVEYNHVREIRNYLLNLLNENFDDLVINSPSDATPYILNFAFKNKRGEVIVNALSNRGIYVSSKSACSSYSKEYSKSVYAVSNDEFISKNSLRVSFSYLTSKEEIDIFVKELKKIHDELKG
jgi:cysteine desulfurase